VLEIALAQVSRRLPAHVSREDLASAAKVALVNAVRQVSGPPEQVHAYCYTRIRGAILDELRRLDPLSRRTRTKVNALRDVADSLAQRDGAQPTEHEIAAAAGVEVEHVRAARRLVEASKRVSLDETDDEGQAIRQLADDAAECPAGGAEDRDAAVALREALGRLPRNQAHVLRRYYFEDATLEEIAGDLGVSKERIRQIREAAERRLRQDSVLACLA
jgi:RNA polymerase sigma factor for flagellar operon FliA